MLPDRRRRFIGHSDPPLSAAGIDQAQRLKDRLHGVLFDAIHSSDLRRSLMTAKIIAQGSPKTESCGEEEYPGREYPGREYLGDAARLSSPSKPASRVRPNAGLREINAGLWEGLTPEEAQTRYPEEFEARERDVVGHPFPHGESFRDLRERVLPTFMEIVDEGGANILIVAHLGVNRVLLCEFLGLPIAELFSIKREYGQMDLLVATRLPSGTRRIEVVPSAEALPLD
jgi:alpha-ribazole phosphatase